MVIKYCNIKIRKKKKKIIQPSCNIRFFLYGSFYTRIYSKKEIQNISDKYNTHKFMHASEE